MVSRDEQYQNAMRNSDKQEARTESDRVLQKVIFSIMADNMELFKQYTDNPEFKKWLSDLVFNLTYNKDGKHIKASVDACTGLQGFNYRRKHFALCIKVYENIETTLQR